MSYMLVCKLSDTEYMPAIPPIFTNIGETREMASTFKSYDLAIYFVDVARALCIHVDGILEIEG